MDVTATAWLGEFEAALVSKDRDRLVAQFYAPECYWRDLLTFTWDARQFYGVDAIVDELLRQVDWVSPRNFVLDPDRSDPVRAAVVELQTVEFFFAFDTTVGRARGHAFLIETETGPKAHIVLTMLDEIRGGEPKSLTERHPGLGFTPEWPGQTWGQFRERQVEYADRDPQVLVVGGGQAGSTIAATLGQLGIDTLVVDKFPRAGDSWRLRYETLALHTPTDMSDFPYFPFPKTFPTYLPKNKYADYLEAYIHLMDLNYWTSSTFLDGSFDEESLTWTVHIDRDGTVRELHPTHVVVAIGGAGGDPSLPPLPGLDSFGGTIVHSSGFRSAADYAGLKAMVVGVGTSAHDIALDLYHNGCDISMLQRGSVSVADIETANTAYGDYMRPLEVPQNEADVRSNTKFLLPLLVKSLRGYTIWSNDRDRELHDGLRNAGFRLDDGEDDTGWLLKFHRYAGGYYLNVGASDVIIDGGIAIVSYDDLDVFTPTGVRLKDGTEHELDVVVLATGYENTSGTVRRFFGDEVAERLGPVGGINESGERANHGSPTAQPHLWFMFGGIVEGRRSVPWVTLQLKANLMGVAPTLVRGPDGRVHPIGNGSVPA